MMPGEGFMKGPSRMELTAFGLLEGKLPITTSYQSYNHGHDRDAYSRTAQKWFHHDHSSVYSRVPLPKKNEGAEMRDAPNNHKLDHLDEIEAVWFWSTLW